MRLCLLGRYRDYSPKKWRWTAATARSASFFSTSTDTRISLEEIIWMLMPASASASNIPAATFSWVSIPAPTMEILATSFSTCRLWAPTISQ